MKIPTDLALAAEKLESSWRFESMASNPAATKVKCAIIDNDTSRKYAEALGHDEVTALKLALALAEQSVRPGDLKTQLGAANQAASDATSLAAKQETEIAELMAKLEAAEAPKTPSKTKTKPSSDSTN